MKPTLPLLAFLALAGCTSFIVDTPTAGELYLAGKRGQLDHLEAVSKGKTKIGVGCHRLPDNRLTSPEGCTVFILTRGPVPVMATAQIKEGIAAFPQTPSKWIKVPKEGLSMFSNEVAIGMTESLVVLALGYPLSRTRRESTFGKSQTWTYGEIGESADLYVFFDNGVVTSWSE